MKSAGEMVGLSGDEAEKPYRRLRAFAGFVVLLSFEAVFLWKWANAMRIDSLWIFVQVLILVASVIAVYGSDTFGESKETAEEVTGDNA